MKFKAFISYKHEEKSIAFAETIEKDLKLYGRSIIQPPMKIFRDEQQLNIGDNLRSRIIDALNEAEYLIYLASIEASKSPWVEKELTYWCADLKRYDRMLVILVNGSIAINPTSNTIDWDHTDCIPTSLQKNLQYEPVYYDLTTFTELIKENQQYRKYINNIVAKLNNLTPEEMQCKELKTYKRNIMLKRIFFISLSTIISLIIFLVVLTFDKNKKHHEAKSLSYIEQSRNVLQYDRTKALGFAILAYNENKRSINALQHIGQVSSICEPIENTIYVRYLGSEHCISPSCKYIASLYEGHIVIWGRSGDHIQTFRHFSRNASISFLGDERIIECDDSSVSLWNLNGEKAWSIKHDSTNSPSIHTSKDNRYIGLIDRKQISIVSSEGKIVYQRTWEGNLCYFSNDLKRAILDSRDTTVVIDIVTKEEKVLPGSVYAYDKNNGLAYLYDDKNMILYDSGFNKIGTYKRVASRGVADFDVAAWDNSKVLAIDSDYITMYLKGKRMWSLKNQDYLYGSLGILLSSGEFVTYGNGPYLTFFSENGKFEYQVNCYNYIQSITELRNGELLVLAKGCRMLILNTNSPRTIRYFNSADDLEIASYRMNDAQTELFTFNGVMHVLKWNISTVSIFHTMEKPGYLRMEQQSFDAGIMTLSQSGELCSYDIKGSKLASRQVDHAIFGSQSSNGIVSCYARIGEMKSLTLFDKELNIRRVVHYSEGPDPVVSGDGSTLARTEDGKVIISTTDGKALSSIPLNDDCTSLMISFNGRLIAQVSSSGPIHVYNAERGTSIELSDESGTVVDCGFSRDSKYIFIRGKPMIGTHQISIFDPNGTLIADNYFASWGNTAPTFSADSSKLFVCHGDQLAVWRFLKKPSYDGIKEFENLSKSDISTITVSGRSDTACVALENSNILAYDEKGRLIVQYRANVPVYSLKLSADDSRLLVQGGNEYGLFNMPSDALIDRLKGFYAENSVIDNEY
jgi:hypothetical protein